MLNPQEDRLDYGEMLTPPINYKLRFAIGTTYSLDLDALVGASLAMGLSEETDSSIITSEIALLEALRATSGKVALFCESGQIHIPSKNNALYTILEKVVFEVQTKKINRIYPSFHPKVWLICYENENKEVLYRLIVLSRNLTFDRSWDVAFLMEGSKQKKGKCFDNQPIIDFVDYLSSFVNKQIDRKKYNEIVRMKEELHSIYFELDDKIFSDVEFFAVGLNQVNKDIKKDELFSGKKKFSEIFVMSPFLSKDIIKNFNDRIINDNNKGILITRISSLSKLDSETCNNFNTYVLDDMIIDGESVISEDDNFVKKQDIHAKIYMLRDGSNVSLYLGSMNASERALHCNIEFMVKLKTKNRYLNIEKLTKSLFGENEDNQIFKKIDLSSIPLSSKNDENLDFILKRIIREGNPKANIVKNNNADGKYDVKLKFTNNIFKSIDFTETEIKISPLLINEEKTLDKEIEFTNANMNQLSKFFKISIIKNEDAIQRLIIVPTDGMPEDRDNAIVSTIVKNEESFVQYLSILLDERFVLTTGSFASSGMNSNSNVFKSNITYNLYEKLLKTAVVAPEKFKEIDYLMTAIQNEGVIPSDFKKIYAKFKKVVK